MFMLKNMYLSDYKTNLAQACSFEKEVTQSHSDSCDAVTSQTEIRIK